MLRLLPLDFSDFHDLRKHGYAYIDENSLGIFDVDNLPTSALLFQTGYLTIKGVNEDSGLWNLGFPNYEVRTALLILLTKSLNLLMSLML